MVHVEHTHSGDSALAFGLTVATAAAFAVGAVVPFFYNATNGAFLSNALSFSAGVMLFVSMVEIYGKSYDGFSEVYCPDAGGAVCAKAFGATLGTFISGCIICVILQSLNKRRMYKKYSAWLTGQQEEEETEASHSDLPTGWQVGLDKASQRAFYFHTATHRTSWNFPGENCAGSPQSRARTAHAGPGTPRAPSATASAPSSGGPTEVAVCVSRCAQTEASLVAHACASEQPESLSECTPRPAPSPSWPHPASHAPPALDWTGPPGLWPPTVTACDAQLEIEAVPAAGVFRGAREPEVGPAERHGVCLGVSVCGRAFGSEAGSMEGGGGGGGSGEADVERGVDAPPACPLGEDEDAEMLASGIVTAIAIAIHNFPEGFVTFMATYKDSSVGASVAFAIAMHNIPEGVCVGAPVYYSTRSKAKTIAAGLFGGVWAPIGGAVAWATFGENDNMDGRAYGCMFGLVCGIMACLSLTELMPLAARYSHSKAHNDICLVLGMLTMGLSILLFAL